MASVVALPLPFHIQLWQLELQRSTLFVSLLLLSLFFIHKLVKPGLKLKLSPSPPKLPIIGNLHQLGKLPHLSLKALSEKYGPDLLFLQLGCVPTLVISSADMVREMVKSNDIVFSNRPRTTAANIFLYGCKDTAFSPYGEYWRQTRKITVVELLSMTRVLSFEYVRKEETERLVRNIRDAISLQIGGKTSSINLSDMLVSTSNDIIARCILGMKSQDDETMNRLGELSRTATTQFTAFSYGNYFPYLRWMDVFTGLIRSLKATFNELDMFLERVIDEHKKVNDHEEDDKSDKKDFVDILLQLQKDDMLDVKVAHDNIKAILVDMFVAGSDATSTTMEWAIAELLKNPSAMKKAQEEVRRVVGKKNKSMIDVNDINQMNYLKFVIKETLRLHPPAVLIPRATSESSGVKLGGYDIPPNTRVYINAWAIQRDPKLWDRPEEFVPERFENNPVDFKGQDFQFIPFGGGRRGCPGLSFGAYAIEYVVANLLYWFDWKLPENAATSPKDLDMNEAFGLAVHKKFPLYVVPIPYSP